MFARNVKSFEKDFIFLLLHLVSVFERAVKRYLSIFLIFLFQVRVTNIGLIKVICACVFKQRPLEKNSNDAFKRNHRTIIRTGITCKKIPF